MAIEALLMSYLNISGPGDISNRCSKIELETDVEENDSTTFGSGGWKEVIPGLQSAKLSVALKNDMVDEALDEDMWTINGTKVAFAAKYSSAATSASNPAYYGTVLIKGWKPIAGDVGSINESDYSWTISGALNRTTTGF